MKKTAALLCLLLQRLYTGDILRRSEICQIENAWESKDVAEMHLLLHLGDDDDGFRWIKSTAKQQDKKRRHWRIQLD